MFISFIAIYIIVTESAPACCKVLTLPGWVDSDPLHWQSRWEQLYGDERVIQHDWQTPLRGDWITRLEDLVLGTAANQPLIFAAHSLGCHLVAAWAQVSRSVLRVQGALLVAPPDIARSDMPLALHSWRKPILAKLPFAAICVLSSNDPFASKEASLQMAASWGARAVTLGAFGHINAASGLGDWPDGRALLAQLAEPDGCIQKTQ